MSEMHDSKRCLLHLIGMFYFVIRGSLHKNHYTQFDYVKGDNVKILKIASHYFYS